MSFTTKRIYAPRSAADGYRVLVDRLWPRGMTKEAAGIDLWLREIAPSTELRRWYGHDVARWPEFRERYRDELSAQGTLLGYQQLEAANSAKSVRIRNGRTSVVDGPFAETKEILGGFNLIEAENMEEAVRIASEFPWAATGCIEVRPIRDIGAVRRRVGLPAQS